MILQHTLGVSSTELPPSIEKYSQRIIFADPPYNQGVKYADDPTGDKLQESDYERFTHNSISALSRYLLPGGTLWWICPPRFLGLVDAAFRAACLKRLYLIIKQETFAQYQQTTLTEDYRLLFCYTNNENKVVFNPDNIRVPSLRQTLYKDKRADSRGRVPGQVWNIRRLQGTSNDRVYWHPAQLPPELLCRVVAGWSQPGDSVLDPFAGSGNMGVVCKRHNRNFTGIDSSATYCDKMKHRLGISPAIVPEVK